MCLFQVFRCHKLLLATCSEAFAKMLFGFFREAAVDRDYEISITKTSPEVFDLAMRWDLISIMILILKYLCIYIFPNSIFYRFVYGRCDDFKSPLLAVGVYFFAQEWMIPHLKAAAEKYLKTFQPEDALKVLEYFVDEENNISAKCLDVSLFL